MRHAYTLPDVTEHGDVLAVTRSAGGTATTLEPGSFVNRDKSTSQNGSEITAGTTSDPETE
jgi:hypothetical protein